MKELANNSTNEDLIEFAKEQCEIFPEDSYMGKYLRETLKMLQAEPSEDAVSRAELLKIYDDGFVELQKIKHLKDNRGANDRQLGVNWCINTLKDMPPVKPTRKKGEWIVEDSGNYNGKYSTCYCSNCKDYYTRAWREMKYCPNCGSLMMEED